MRLAIFALGLWGCFTSEDTFIKDNRLASCAAMFNCSKAAFLVEYDDVDDCVHENEDEAADLQDLMDESNCDYDQDDADDCMDQTRLYGVTCNQGDGEAVAKECGKVYDCD